jgi:UDP-2-acetamido-2-deoxy-ribo-hexuluronate aminotransferase
MPNKISLFQNDRNWAQIKNQVCELIEQDHRSGQAQNTQLVKRLESRLAERFNRRYCVTTASCTDALVLSMMALNLPKRSFVGVSNYTFTASAHAIARAGYIPVPIDTGPDYCIDVHKIVGVKAILTVDMFGNMCDWNALDQLSIPVINDAAQSLESRNTKDWSASKGVISCISFSPSKTVSSWGSGGALLTDHEDIAKLAQQLRLHGKNSNDALSIAPGMNSMISNFEAACIWAGLDHSESWHRRRSKISNYLIGESRYQSTIDLTLEQHTHQKLVFQSPIRDQTLVQFQSAGIDCAVHYRTLINDEKIYNHPTHVPISTQLSRSSFTVPNQHTLTDEEVEKIAKELK